MTFPPATLALLARTPEVDIETRSARGAAHRVPIWVVVDREDVFVRTYRGDKSRWYRELLAAPGALVAGSKRIGVRAVRAIDPESIRRASAGYRAKYRRGGSLDAMLRPAILDTTLRLERT